MQLQHPGLIFNSVSLCGVLHVLHVLQVQSSHQMCKTMCDVKLPVGVNANGVRK